MVTAVSDAVTITEGIVEQPLAIVTVVTAKLGTVVTASVAGRTSTLVTVVELTVTGIIRSETTGEGKYNLLKQANKQTNKKQRKKEKVILMMM